MPGQFHRGAHAVRAQQGGDASEGLLELAWVLEGRLEQAELPLRRNGGLEREPQSDHRALAAHGLEVGGQQALEHGRVAAGFGHGQPPLEPAAGLEAQRQFQGLGRAGRQRKPGTERSGEAVQQEEQGLEGFHRVLEVPGLGPHLRRTDRVQRPGAARGGRGQQAQGLEPQAVGQLGRIEGQQVAHRAQAPAGEDPCRVARGFQGGHGQGGDEARGVGHHVDRLSEQGRKPGQVGGRTDADARAEPLGDEDCAQFASPGPQGVGFGRLQPAQAAEVHRAQPRGGGLEVR